MQTVSEQQLHRDPERPASSHTPISRGLRIAAERVPGLLMRLADRTEHLENALVHTWQKRQRVRAQVQRMDPQQTEEEERAERAASLGRRDDWDAIDEASWESFPASDPPSTWAGGDSPSTR